MLGPREIVRAHRSFGGQGGAARTAPVSTAIGGIDGPEEMARLEAVNAWVEAQGLPHGIIGHELTNPQSGAPVAVLDLAWPDGIQPGLSEPVALLLDETPELMRAANAAGYRYFTSEEAFQAYAALPLAA